MQEALASAIAALEPRDRLRLRLYHSQDMTLAVIGKALKEHEATVSRHLTRTRKAIREDVERRLKEVHGFDEATRQECFRAVADDAGTLDLERLMAGPEGPAYVRRTDL